MSKSTSEMWDNRYSDEAFVYGIKPNEFLKEELLKLKTGKVLLPAEGEGRNAVFAARNNWTVVAFDLSEQGKLKAMGLAEKHQVKINYHIAGFEEFSFDEEAFDCIALIYAHVPGHKRKQYHRMMMRYLKPGGIMLLEGFSKQQLGNKSGGPGQLEMLFSRTDLLDDFSELEIVKIEELDVDLNEGDLHKGKASVIRYIGKK